MDRKEVEEMADRLAKISEEIEQSTKDFLIAETERLVGKDHQVAMLNYVCMAMGISAVKATNNQLERNHGRTEASLLNDLFTDEFLPEYGKMLRLLGIGDVIGMNEQD